LDFKTGLDFYPALIISGQSTTQIHSSSLGGITKLFQISLLKYTSAIVLILIHAFNMGGYLPLYNYLINKADEQQVSVVERQEYADSELIVVKTALHLPYFTGNSDYTRVDGRIEMNGTQYNYVKRKVSNDTLYLLCIPNQKKTALYAEKNSLSGQYAEAPSANKNQKSTVKKTSPLSEYNCPEHRQDSPAAAAHEKKQYFPTTSSLRNNLPDHPFPPPKDQTIA
jgi:hypothetical protein